MLNIMNKKALRQFLLEANKAGYANAGGSKNWVKEKDGSTTIIFESGDFKMRDNYFGGEPYGGNEVVFFKNSAVWMMVYYGWVDVAFENFKEVYTFLQKALSKPPEDIPLRGLSRFEDGNFVYDNKWEGDIKQYSGEETISKDGKEIYRAKYSGGLVDRRKE